MDKKKFVNHILNFYDTKAREFPWRKTKDPYKILLTEILLRKTTSTQVNLIYSSFFTQYPNLESLAEAKLEDLETLIKCLGLFKQRSEQMKTLARIIIKKHGGEIPKNYTDLINLPGVGMYTVGGFLCLACKEDISMVDTNVIRVISRYFNFRSKNKHIINDKKTWKFVTDMIPPGKCKEFNLGLIDFASVICTPHNPKCEKCPLNDECYFFNKLNDN